MLSNPCLQEDLEYKFLGRGLFERVAVSAGAGHRSLDWRGIQACGGGGDLKVLEVARS